MTLPTPPTLKSLSAHVKAAIRVGVGVGEATNLKRFSMTLPRAFRMVFACLLLTFGVTSAQAANICQRGLCASGCVCSAAQPYVGQITTRPILPNNFVAAGSESQMSESFGFARVIRTPTWTAFAVPTWFVKHSTQLETGTGGTWQFQTSINYPPGTCTPAGYLGSGTFSSLVSGVPASLTLGSTALQTVPDNADNWFAVNISIPNNARPGFRIFATGGPGIINYGPGADGGTATYNAGEDYINGERYVFGTSGVHNATQDCIAIPEANSATAGSNGFGPVAIVGPTTAISWTVWGDSKDRGLGDFYNDASTNVGEEARSIGPYFAYINMGVSAQSVANWIATPQLHQIALSHLTSHFDSQMSYNDLVAGGNIAPTVVANLQTAWTMFGATRIYVNTVAPSTTSTDAWQTVGNQTAASYSSAIDAFNTLVKAGIANTLGYFDFGAPNRDSVSTDKWAVGTISAVFTATCAVKTLTVTAVASGTINRLDTLNGVGIPADESIVSQLTATGAPGGVGTYSLPNTCTVGSPVTVVSNTGPVDGVHQTGALNQAINAAGVFTPLTVHYPYLLRRDIDPASNDNTPAFLNQAA